MVFPLRSAQNYNVVHVTTVYHNDGVKVQPSAWRVHKHARMSTPLVYRCHRSSFLQHTRIDNSDLHIPSLIFSSELAFITNNHRKPYLFKEPNSSELAFLSWFINDARPLDVTFSKASMGSGLLSRYILITVCRFSKCFAPFMCSPLGLRQSRLKKLLAWVAVTYLAHL